MQVLQEKLDQQDKLDLLEEQAYLVTLATLVKLDHLDLLEQTVCQERMVQMVLVVK